MNKSSKNIFAKPKLIITLAVILAVIIGAVFLTILHNKRAKLFSAIPAAQSDATSTSTAEDLTLAFPTGGRIESVSVKIGDKVTKGQVLASLDSENAIGAVNQANGAYVAAENNYNKLVAGSTESSIQIAQVALTNAKNNYDDTVASQKVLVANALLNLHNSGLQAIPTINNADATNSPVISGTYDSPDEGTYSITVYATDNGYYFSYSGLESGTGNVGTLPVALGTHGLNISFPQNFVLGANNTWNVAIPNTQSPTYLATYNAYQTALQTQTQTIATAQGAVDSAQANFDSTVAGARSEDLQIAQAQVQSAEGALQIAQGNYNNTIITAPVSGTITNVSITAGQIATPNTPVIELLSSN